MDLFELVATLALDTSQYDSGLNGAESKASKFGEALKKGLGTAAKVGAAALGAAATGIGVLVKNSVEAYADYEQLVGGIETLFKGSASTVLEYANNAYKTAGLSANEYMTTVTGFSASLLQSLGGDTAAAAKLADQAIIDMSDNANKMGSDMGSIQRAYQGFAKQNYTMLDNLKLGYGGTKKEMERLLADAEKLSGVKYDMSSYADVINAIHVIQENMGITGTTAKEASETISGSVAAMKSAWQNLVTGIADENANFDQLIANFVDSAVTAGDNLIPRIEQALTGVGRLVEGLAPVIAERLPAFIEAVLPPILAAASTLIDAVVQSLPTIIKALIEALPGVVEMVISTVVSMAPEIVELGVELVVALINGIAAATPQLIAKLPEIVAKIATTLIQNAPKILQAGIALIAALASGMIQNISAGIQAARQIFDNIRQTITSLISGAWQWGADLINNFVDGIKAFISRPIDAIRGLAGKIKALLGFSEPEEGPLSNFHTYAPDMMRLFAEGIERNAGMIASAVSSAFNLKPAITAGASGKEEVFTVPKHSPSSAGNGNMTVILELNGTELGRAVTPLVEAEQRRMGVRLAMV